MKKSFLRILSVMLIIVLSVSCLPIGASAATSKGNLGGNVKWTYDSGTKTITVSGSGNMKNFSKANDGQGFNSLVIGTAQYPNKDATKIVISDGVTNIGNNAFRSLTGVKSVTIPSSITSIGQSAFEGCSALNSVNFTSNLTSIGAYAFKSTRLASVDMPYTVKSIGDYAFDNISGFKMTCFYGDTGYNYCIKHNAAYTFRQIAPVLSTSLDEAAKQVKLTFKIKNPVGFNAANFTITYNNAVTPASSQVIPDTISSEATTTSAVVFNETGKISVAMIATDSIKYEQCDKNVEYEVATIAFNINDQADKASFTVSPDMFMLGNAKLSVHNATANVDLHKFTEKITKAATCNATGEKTSTCSICGKVKTEAIAKDANNHVGGTEIKNAVAATCTKEGKSGDTVCKGCGAVLTKSTSTPKTAHDYASVVTAPTCTEGGFTTFTCTVCGDSYTGDKVQALGHDYNENGVCTRCGYVSIVTIGFKEGSKVVVNNDEKTVIIKTTAKAAEMKDMITTTGWEVLDGNGNAIEDTKAVPTGATLKHTATGTVYTVIILGDVNMDGIVNASDARSTLRVSARLDSFTSMQEIAAKVSGKSTLSAADARTILRVSAKLDTF